MHAYLRKKFQVFGVILKFDFLPARHTLFTIVTLINGIQIESVNKMLGYKIYKPTSINQYGCLTRENGDYSQTETEKMRYTEIEKLITYSKDAAIAKFWRMKVGETEAELLKEIEAYDCTPAINEMQNNFQKNFHLVHVSERIEKDYNVYMKQFEEILIHYSKNEQELLSWKMNRLKKQLETKTISADVMKTIPEELKTAIAKETAENLYKNIFLNGLSYAIFKRLHNKYKKNERMQQLNYSFLYGALKEDNLVICDSKEWINFLFEEYDIELARVEPDQDFYDKNSILYKAVKRFYT